MNINMENGNYRAFRSDGYDKKFQKLDNSEQERISKFEQSLKKEPYSGKPLGYKFFREKKFNGKRVIFLVYEDKKCVFLITITTKKTQQYEIDMIKENFKNYKNQIDRLIGNI